jgi:hypothetical protein
MEETRAFPIASLFSIEQEYGFVRDKWVKCADSAFDDFKLYAALGGVVGWQPIVSFLPKNCFVQVDLLLAGFLALSALTAVIMLREFLRQSLALFYLRRVLELESCLGQESSNSKELPMMTGRAWMLWAQRRHGFIGRIYYVLLFAIVAVFPAIALLYGGEPKHAGIYVVVSLVFLAFPFLAYHRLYVADSAYDHPLVSP